MADRKYITIAELIRSDIRRGVYAEGDTIPPIRALAERYGANPQTVNKATAYLESLGLLEPRRGAGSKVLKPEPVQETKRRRVLMLIDKGRSRLLDDLNDLGNYHGKDIYLSYMMQAAERGFDTGFSVYDKDEGAEALCSAELEGADACIVQGSLPDCLSSELMERDLPTVLINRRPPQGNGRFAAVLIPNDGIRELVNYLSSLGHRRFLYALSSRFDRTVLFEERLRTLESAVDACGLALDSIRVFEYSENSSKDGDRLAALSSEGFHAVVAFNDVSALGMYGLASRAGLSVPGDLSVVGFDDIALAQMAVPPLTTVRVDRKDLVSKAFDLLDLLAARESPARLVREVSAQLVIRQSAYRI